MSLIEITDYLQANFAERDIILRPPASEELIRKVEEMYGIILPKDIKQFYKFTNGFDTYDWLFNLISMEDMIDQKVKYKYNDESLPLAEYMTYAETWHLEVNPHHPDKYNIIIFDGKSNIILTHSLAEFIQRFLDGGLFGENGLCHWAEQL
jgi:cell wall assembly regulator SMI1